MIEKSKPYCVSPWYNFIYINNTKSYSPCCCFLFESEKEIISGEIVGQCFNSADMVDLRKRLADHDLSGLPCEDCVYNPQAPENFRNVPDFNDFPEHVEKVKQAFHGGMAALEYMPLQLGINLSYRCNIQCVMCPLSSADENHPAMEDKGEINNSAQVIDDIRFENIATLGFIGGEIFYSKDGIRMLEYLSHRHIGKTRIVITTNGTLIKKHLPLIEKIPNLRLQISIDGCEDSYEKIRKPAKWGTLTENIASVRAIKTNGYPFLYSCSLVMYDSIASLPDTLLYLFKQTDLFDMRQINGEFLRQNVFRYPSLLEDVHWEGYFKAAIKIAWEKDIHHVYRQLKRMYRSLLIHFKNPPRKIIRYELNRIEKLLNLSFPLWQFCGYQKSKFCIKDVMHEAEKTFRWLKRRRIGISRRIEEGYEILRELAVEYPLKYPQERFRDFRDVIRRKQLERAGGKSVVIWGTGGNYRQNYAEWLRRNIEKIRFLGFIDGDGEKWKQTCDGFHVHPPDYLIENRVDVIIIASACYDTIRKTVEKSACGDAYLIIPGNTGGL